jgi:uncharacterized membrane protein
MSDPTNPTQPPPRSGPQQSGRVIRQETIEVAFTGPLPHPQILQGYEQACPGAASRIIEMAEQQGSNRRLIEQSLAASSQDEMRRQFQEARVGQICAAIVALAFIGSGAYVATHGNPWPGAALGGGGVGLQALVATFVRGRRSAEDKEESGEGRNKPRDSSPKPQSGKQQAGRGRKNK